MPRRMDYPGQTDGHTWIEGRFAAWKALPGVGEGVLLAIGLALYIGQLADQQIQSTTRFEQWQIGPNE